MTGMKRVMMAAVGIMAMSGVTMSGAVVAQEKMGQEKMKLTEAQCESAWSKANPDNKAKISESAAEAYISDLKAVNKDNDGTIERPEFMRACDMGLVKSSATTGGSSSSGESGSSGSSKDYKSR